MPKVSVIIPNFNNEMYLDECLNSLLNQTLDDIEIIVIDDCSTDNSMSVLQAFQAKHPTKVKVLRNKENSGAGQSRNNGLDIATGEFIKFLDADDTMDPDVLETMYNAAKEHDVKMVIGQMKIMGPNGRVIEGKTNQGNEAANFNVKISISEKRDELVHGTAGIGDELFARELFDGVRFPALKWEDFATIPALKVKAGDIYMLDKVVYNYRIHNTSTTTTDLAKKTPRIMDIVGCVNNLRTMIPDEYKAELDALEVIHYRMRMIEIASWKDCSDKHKKILINSLQRILELHVPDMEANEYFVEKNDGSNLSDYILKDIMTAEVPEADLYQQLQRFDTDSQIADMIEYLHAEMSSDGEPKHNEEDTIKKTLAVAEAVKDSTEYATDDKKIIITSLYKLLSGRIPNLEEKLAKLRPSQNKFGKRDDDDRHHGMWAQVKSYMDPKEITSADIDEILRNVQSVVTSKEFLEYSPERMMGLLTPDIENGDFDIARGAEQEVKPGEHQHILQ